MAKISARGARELRRWERRRLDGSGTKAVLVLTSDGRLLQKSAASTSYHVIARASAEAKKKGEAELTRLGELYAERNGYVRVWR